MLQPGLLDLSSARRRAVGVPCRGAAPQKYSAGSARPRRAQVFLLEFRIEVASSGPFMRAVDALWSSDGRSSRSRSMEGFCSAAPQRSVAIYVILDARRRPRL